mmetsp:Transcript_14408/g.22211  ORF Transcript_14408/g.22211 Transcript_14408/m.22211 type:complete len:191 (+) Transcript_14408:175-747(+)
MLKVHSSKRQKQQKTRNERTCFKTYEFALIICRNSFQDSPDYGKWLAVNESRGRGWWIPGGAVDYDEQFDEAAKRECLEEAGIEVNLKGVLKVDHGAEGDEARMRVIFYAEPTTLEMSTQVKKVPDEESVEARWVTLDELVELGEKPPGLRGSELLTWGKYLEDGGQAFPLAVFGREGETIKPTDKAYTI